MEKRTAQQLTESVIDGCTRAKAASIALKRLGCSISQVSVGGKNPTILIEHPPGKAMTELTGETRRKWRGAGGREVTSYLAPFMGCRVEWTAEAAK